MTEKQIEQQVIKLRDIGYQFREIGTKLGINSRKACSIFHESRDGMRVNLALQPVVRCQKLRGKNE